MQKIDCYIPDVHGMTTLLAETIEFVERHCTVRGGQPRFFFLGDVVDRGPDSRGSMETVYRTIETYPGSKLLMGNHEEMFLDGIRSDGRSELAGTWGLNGGLETMTSYVGRLDVDGFFKAMKTTYAHHHAMMRDASPYVENGGLIGVHAGIDPTLDISEQKRKTLMWVRETFLDYVDPRIRPVVHGHTIVGLRPVVTENRISLDTGAQENGRLTSLIVDPGTWEVSFAQATDVDVRYVEPKRLDRGYGTVLDDPRRIFDRDYVPEYTPRLMTVTRP